MPKVNIYLPDDLAEAVKDAGVPVSAVCQRALEQAVRRVTAIREIAGEALPAGPSDPAFVNFTKRAMRVLQSAQAAARAGEPAEIGTEHLLSALVADDNMAVRLLTALEITPQQIRSALASRELAGTGSAASRPPDGDATAAAAGFSPQAATVLELATTESSGLGTNYVGSEHLALGLIGEPDGMAGSVLRSLGADLRVARRMVAAALVGWRAGFAAHEDQPLGHGEDKPSAGQAAEPGAQGPAQLADVIKAELAPVLARIERLESRAVS